MATSKLQTLWNHPAGPKTVHFWAPTFKWGISIANIADFAEKLIPSTNRHDYFSEGEEGEEGEAEAEAAKK